MSPIVVRAIPAEQHLDFVAAQPSASFLQTPAWGKVKGEWRHESIGWFRDEELVGAGLVLYRQLPAIKKFLAYLPEGPVLDWSTEHLADWLTPMAAYLDDQFAFGIRLGPPVVRRSWTADTVKRAIADPAISRLTDVAPDATSTEGEAVHAALQRLGWRPLATEGGFSAGQPQYVFQIPLAGQTPDDVLRGMNQQWRRNIKKAAKSGVLVETGTSDDLARFHRLYAETATRDHFTPRPLAYFQQMFTALQAEDKDRIRLYLATHEEDLVAATIAVRVGGHAWYSYGASSTAKREVRGSNAVQWRMICDAIEAGATVYDLRGITDTLDPDDPHVGLIQFKVGTGGVAVEYLGEWDLPLNRVIYKAFDLYMSRR